MKQEITTCSVTLLAENVDDANLLLATPYTTLRETYKIPNKKELVINYNGFRDLPTNAQYYLPGGGYTVVDR